jgi:hypothetical protein
MPSRTFTAFSGSKLLAAGAPASVWADVMVERARAREAAILVFDDGTGKIVDLDPRSPPRDDEELGTPLKSGPGRPKLGVVAREVTLLPRHWEFLNAEPGGASAALRRLVDKERRTRAEKGDRRASQAAAYAFISAIAGDRTNFEEATRALFADDKPKFQALTEIWPADIRLHAMKLGFNS